MPAILATTLRAQSTPAETPPAPVDDRTSAVFNRYAPYVAKIQVIETGSGAKSTIGSGFFVTPDGHVITNYHVVSSAITKPERYRVELIDRAGKTFTVSIAAIDVVHDLAALRTKSTGHPYFVLHSTDISQGRRLFSLGNPKDLGLGIVEGTYQGLLEHTLYPRVHLTASLNPGMSGGPTIDEAGNVIGVNVSTEGNQVSFLIPADRVQTLLQTALAISDSAPAPGLDTVAAQLRRHQDDYLKKVFAEPVEKLSLGPFQVVTQPAPFFRCWGDVVPGEGEPYEISRHRCDTDDEIYLDDDQTSGWLSISYRLITTKQLNEFQFFSQYGKTFGVDNSPSGSAEYVTNWECTVKNVRNGRTRMRTALCLRRYKRLGELYDASLKAAVLGGSGVGLVSSLNLTGVTFDNVKAMSTRFLKEITWR